LPLLPPPPRPPPSTLFPYTTLFRSALTRPGRFDLEITVNLADMRGREQILRVHARKLKLEDGLDLTWIARGTPGFSGADLANLRSEEHTSELQSRSDLVCRLLLEKK